MAKKFMSRDDKSAARKRAEDHFKPKTKKAAAKPAKRVLPDLTAGLPKQRDYSHHLDQAKKLKAVVESASGAYRAQLKKTKEVGIDPAVVTATMSWAKKDPETLTMYFRQLREAFRAAGIKIQLDMFDQSSVCREAQIYDDGFKAGEAGQSASECPHEANTRAGQVWLFAYAGGQSKLATETFGGGAKSEDPAEPSVKH